MIAKDLSFIHAPHGRLASMTVHWNPDNRARMILAHGYCASATMSEHGKLFYETAEKAADENIGSLMFDFTGNGLSDGYFRDISPNRRIAELSSVIDHVRKD